MESIDTAHADLLNILLSTTVDYIEGPTDKWWYFRVLPHAYDNAGPLADALAFGIRLADVLIAAGYEAVMVSNIGKAGTVGGTLPVVLIAVELDGVRVDMTVDYYLHPSAKYYLFMYDDALEWGCGDMLNTIERVVDYLPTFITRARHGMQMAPIYRECSSCHWGDDTGYHCGMGLVRVSTDECTHYRAHVLVSRSNHGDSRSPQ